MIKIRRAASIFLMLNVFIFSPGCVYQHLEEVTPIPPCVASSPVGFAETVQPIIASKCAIPSCHDGSNSHLSWLNTFNEVSGNSSDITTQLSNHAMPPKNMPQLSTVQLANLTCWISQGAKTK